MASVNQKQANLISNKLTFLKDQGDDLISAVGQYVNRITTTGDSWTQGGDNKLEYLEVCQMIDSAVLFLWGKCEGLTDLTSQSITASAFTPATSDRQPAAPLASTATTSYRQSTESDKPADHVRMDILEQAMCFFRSRTEKVAEQQSGIDQQLKELLSNLSESDKKYSSGFEQIKQQIRDISDAQDAIKQEQKTRLQSLEKQLQKISTAQDRQKVEMESQAEMVEKLVDVPNLLESVKENVDTLDARIEEIIDDCRNKHEDVETVSRDLADKIIANTQSAQLISEGQAQNTTLLRELETRLQTLEADGGRNVKGVQKQIERGEANFRLLCQMLNNRLRPLEQLRTCLNERASVRDDNITKLYEVIEAVAVMSPRIRQLELKSPLTSCGFSAQTWFTGDGIGDTIRQYEIKYSNVGENFNAHSGIFTAPVDGLYVASISLWLYRNQEVQVDVRFKQCLDQTSVSSVCVCSAVAKGATSCSVGVVGMKAGDVLFSVVNHLDKTYTAKLVFFSCFLLGRDCVP